MPNHEKTERAMVTRRALRHKCIIPPVRGQISVRRDGPWSLALDYSVLAVSERDGGSKSASEPTVPGGELRVAWFVVDTSIAAKSFDPVPRGRMNFRRKALLQS